MLCVIRGGKEIGGNSNRLVSGKLRDEYPEHAIDVPEAKQVILEEGYGRNDKAACQLLDMFKFCPMHSVEGTLVHLRLYALFFPVP